MPSAGRPRALDEVKQREVCALVSAGCGIRHAARYVGCVPSTIHREARRNREFGEKLRRSTTYAELNPLQAMQQAARTDWRAAAWLLERTRPDRFARGANAALSPKQARALGQELLQLLDRENLDPFQHQRLETRIQTTIECAIADACGTDQSRRKQRRAIAFYSHLDQISDPCAQAGVMPLKLDELTAAYRRDAKPGTPAPQDRRQRPRPPRRTHRRFMNLASQLRDRFDAPGEPQAAEPASAVATPPNNAPPSADAAQN